MQLYLRKLNYQIISKLILALYSVLIVSKDILVLPKTLYITIIICYLLVNFFFLKYAFYREKSHFSDMILVLFLLSGTKLDHYLIFTYLLYPLVSRGVYIDRFTYDRYFNWEFLFLLLILNLTVEKQCFDYYLWQLLPLAFCVLLNGMSVLRMRYDEKKIKLLDIADDYFIQLNYSYEVYRQVINYLKEQGIEVANITCLECDVKMRKFHIVNSSYLISSCQLELKQDEHKSLINGMTIYNANFTLDKRKQRKNEVYPVIQNNSTPRYFLFIVSYNPEAIKRIDLAPLFLRMSRLISFERIIRNRRDASIQDILQKSKFVNSATNTMHFLKNRLTPLQTLIDLVKNDGGVKQLDGYDGLLAETAHSAQKEMNVILKKAEYLLNKQNNPFVFSKESYDAHSIFTTLSSVWSNGFSLIPIETVISGDDEKTSYDTNIEGLEILFSDIVGNMIKYSKSYQHCVFTQNEDMSLNITFENDFGSKNEVVALVNDVNNPNKDAVIYRTSYGVSNIRAIADNLAIGLHASIKTQGSVELYNLELTFKAKDDENTNH